MYVKICTKPTSVVKVRQSREKRRTKKRSSYKERKVNALALGADEGRG